MRPALFLGTRACPLPPRAAPRGNLRPLPRPPLPWFCSVLVPVPAVAPGTAVPGGDVSEVVILACLNALSALAVCV